MAVSVFPEGNGSTLGGAGGGGGGQGAQVEDAVLPDVKGANNQMEDKRIRSNGSKNDDVEQLKLQLTEMFRSLSSSDNHLIKIVKSTSSLQDCVIAILNILCTSTANRDSSPAPAVTDTAADKDAMSRMKGLLGSMCSIVDKLPMFFATIFLWLLSNSKAGQDFKDPWMQVLIIGNLILFFISFILMALASKLKDSESVDGVLCKIFIWLLLPVFLALWPGLCMILHFFAHSPVFVLWPIGALLSILSLCFWYWVFYKEQRKILKDILPEKPESEAALAKV